MPSQIEMPDRFVLIYDQPIKPGNGADMYRDIDPSDEWDGANYPGEGTGVLWFYSGIEDKPEHPVKGPHKQGHNILFGDGHAKWFEKWDNRNMSRYFTFDIPTGTN
jgi:prepilin-type processing-associated H-X9-DG protein